MKKFRYEGAPRILGMALGKILEVSLRESLILSRGELSIFVTRPISLGFAIVAAILLILPAITQRKKIASLEQG